jgi:nitrite reductase (NADH) small subunit
MNLDGVLRAIRNRCAHQGGPLGEGPITRTIAATEHTDWDPETCFEARVVRCPWHSLEYDLDTGLAIGNPRYRVKVYEVRIRGDFLEILL